MCRYTGQPASLEWQFAVIECHSLSYELKVNSLSVSCTHLSASQAMRTAHCLTVCAWISLALTVHEVTGQCISKMPHTNSHATMVRANLLIHCSMSGYFMHGRRKWYERTHSQKMRCSHSLRGIRMSTTDAERVEFELMCSLIFNWHRSDIHEITNVENDVHMNDIGGSLKVINSTKLGTTQRIFRASVNLIFSYAH